MVIYKLISVFNDILSHEINLFSPIKRVCFLKIVFNYVPIGFIYLVVEILNKLHSNDILLYFLK